MDFRGTASYFIIIFNLIVLFYFVALNTIYLMLFTAAYIATRKYTRRRKVVDLYEVFRSPLTPSVSVMVPAYNEEATILESLRSVLLLHYPRFEVVVINDGSTDRTLEVMKERYKLRRITKLVPERVPCELIRDVYISSEFENLVVVDKENGGKSDALNAGINVSRYDLMCVLDADSLMEADGLLKVARPFIEDPSRTVAVGGLVRIVNGCEVEGGAVTEVRLPRKFLPNLQVVEYLRAFLGGRMGWSALRSLLIISGAFGLFKKENVIDVGGYRKETVGEDMDLVVRMHRDLRERKIKYRMYFVPDPVCWTEAPEKYGQLARQRDRWQRGLLEAMTGNIRMLFNPRYGVIGLFAMPYFFFFEMLGPPVELLGYAAVILALALSMVDFAFFYLFIAIAFLYSMITSLFSVYLEGLAFQRYPRIPSLLKLAAFAIIENIGYRQVNAWWRSKAFITVFTRRKKWGAMERRGYVEPEEKPEKEKAPRPRARYAWLLLIPIIALAIVLPWQFLRNRKPTGNYLSEIPTVAESNGTQTIARANGRYFDIHLENGWKRFTVKGANVGIALPGKWFSEFPANEDLYQSWFEEIAAMNVNTIRIYTLLDPVFYRTLDKFNKSSPRKLMLLQEIWPADEIPENNLYDQEYTREYREEISMDIDALMGKANIPERQGRAWGNFDTDVSQYLLGVMIGREILYEEASTTNAMNPDKNGYKGSYIQTTGPSNAVETWLAETCDYTVEVMQEEYDWQIPVCFVSWPTLDPMVHPTESTPGVPKEQEHEDIEILDPNHLSAGPDSRAGLFACYHIYPYYPDFMNREPAYAEYRDDDGVLRYGGYLKQFMELHPNYPALMGEFGMSTSMGIAHLQPEGFNHGGVSEKEQGEQITRMYEAMLDEGFAGGVIFEWADEWAKRAWVDMAYMIPFDRHIYWHNMMDPEQNFGVMAYDPDHDPFSGGEAQYYLANEEDKAETGSGSEIKRISVDSDAAFAYLQVEFSGEQGNELKPGSDGDMELLVGIDTFGDDNGTRSLPAEGLPELPTGVEFLLKINSKDGGLLLARPDYNRGENKFIAAPSVDPEFVEIRLLVNREQINTETGELFPIEYTNDSILQYGDFDPESDQYYSLANWFVEDDGKKLTVRLPWLLLNVSDPSSNTVLHDERNDLPPGPSAIVREYPRDGLGTQKTQGFLFYTVLTGSKGLLDFQPEKGTNSWDEAKRYDWPGWDQPKYRSRLKKSYELITNFFFGIKDTR